MGQVQLMNKNIPNKILLVENNLLKSGTYLIAYKNSTNLTIDKDVTLYNYNNTNN